MREATTPSLIAWWLDPVENLPAMRARIGKGEYNGFFVVGNQFGPEGLKDREVIFCHEVLSESGQFEIHHPQVGRGGMYPSFGHYPFTTTGNTKLSGDGKIHEGSTTFRTALKPDGRLFNWVYSQQYINAEQKGKSYNSGHSIKFKNYIDEFVHIATHVILNNPDKRDGELAIYVNGEEFARAKGVQWVSSWDQLAKGYGMLHQHQRATNEVEEALHIRRLEILGR